MARQAAGRRSPPTSRPTGRSSEEQLGASRDPTKALYAQSARLEAWRRSWLQENGPRMVERRLRLSRSPETVRPLYGATLSAPPGLAREGDAVRQRPTDLGGLPSS